jgi:CelD/BcsL family acetyltransferase involved in cellulose biosynthesis
MKVSTSQSPIATFSPCPPADQLERDWRELEARSSGSVFLSWPWIGATLIHLRPSSVLVRISCGEQTIGLGLLGRSGRTLFAPRLHLNETGEPDQDRIMTEYNGLLIRQGWEQAAVTAFLAALEDSKELGRRDLYLSGVSRHWQDSCRAQGFKTRLLRIPQTAPYAALQTGPDDDLLAGMTRNSRQQIRRSLRHYERQGPLTLDRAQDVPQALDWLDALEALHTSSWNQRGKAGAFSASSFMAFHRRLIVDSFTEGVSDLLRARAGEDVLGYLYNLRWRGVAASYQSGFRFEENAQARPGLVAHLLAMRLYRSEGLSAYRFLAGEARYKTSLATDTDELLWMLAYRPGMVRWLTGTARRSITSLLARIGALGSVIDRKIDVKAWSSKKPS